MESHRASGAGSTARPTMKIAIIMPLAEQRGGGELMLLHLMQQGRDMGVEWLVIFLADGPMVGQIEALGIHPHVVLSGRLREAHRFPRTVQKIAALLKEHQCDVVIGWMGHAHFYGGPSAILAKIPALWYQLGIPLDKGRMDRLATRLPARGILACSQAGADAQAQRVIDIELRKLP
jgi:hypothetical protein